MSPDSIRNGQIFQWKLSVKYKVVGFWFIGQNPKFVELQRLDTYKIKPMQWDEFILNIENGYLNKIQ